MAFDPKRPFNDLPRLPPAADIETRRILKSCIESRAALAELKTAGRLIPNQAVLVNSLPILEAQASSEIENVITTTDRMFQFAGDARRLADPATLEALRYRTALQDGLRALGRRPLSTRLAVEVCRTIKDVALDIRTVPGTALMNEATQEIVYTPPEGADRLRDLLANWERFLHDATEIDPLIRMAVGHYQFEAIHPFTDGNGRTGRILNLLFLVEAGLIDIPVLHLSRYIVANKAQYYRLLRGVTAEGRWEDWILYMLDAVRDTAQWTTAKVAAIRALLDATAQKIQRRKPKIYSRELAEIVFVRPYCRIGDLVESGIARRQSASVYLKALAEIGVLEERKAGREKLFVNPAFLDLLADRVPPAPATSRSS